MILSFTGTRRGMTDAQKRGVLTVYDRLQPTTLIHGGAVGADREASNLAHGYHYRISAPFFEVYPADEQSAELWRRSLTHTDGRLTGRVHPVMLPLERNRIIAQRCNLLVACLAEAREIRRSGTWATVRYAQSAGKPIVVIAPDGSFFRTTH